MESESEPRKRRIGKYFVDSRLIEEGEFRFAECLWKLGFVPVRVEYLATEDRFEYVGLSPQFDLVPEGTAVPEYSVWIDALDTGEIALVKSVRL